MNRLSRSVLAVAAAALMASAVTGVSSAATSGPYPPGLGIQLAEAPRALANDPRAHVYIVDHVNPGAAFTRHFRVTNGTDRPMHVQLYADAARVDHEGFVVDPGRSQNELTRWVSVEPVEADLPPQSAIIAAAHFSVPPRATSGERYGVLLAQSVAPAEQGGQLSVSARAGIRVYLDVSTGGAPPTDFAISTLRGARLGDGTPTVTAAVTNTGRRALDVTGSLRLDQGPGGLSAGPFQVAVPRTLAIGDTGDVIVKLDKSIPDGPWRARMDLQSGEVKHAAEATITFPTQAGTVGKTVKAKAVPLTKNKQVLGIVAGSIIGLVLVGILIFLFLLWKRRGDDEDDDKRRSGPPSIPQSRAKESLRDRVRR